MVDKKNSWLKEILARYKENKLAKASKVASKKLDRKLLNKLLSNKKGTGLLNTKVSDSIKMERKKVFGNKIKDMIKNRKYRKARNYVVEKREEFLK